MTEPAMRTIPPIVENEFVGDAYLLAHVSHALRRDWVKVTTILAVAAVGYLLSAVLFFLTAPSERVIRLPFRLEFAGAQSGTYPNSTRFSVSDIVGGPILLKVYQQNHLERFTTFARFSSAIFLAETNPKLQEIEATYAAKLADRSLSPVDRERIEREYELKRAGISKLFYSLNYASAETTRRIPDVLAEKALTDILQTWAASAAQSGALRLPVPMLSSETITRDALSSNPLIALFQLRDHVRAVLSYVGRIADIPGAETIRSSVDGPSLEDIRFHLESIQHFQIEPLATDLISRSGGSPKTQETITSFLAYNERLFRSTEASAAAIRETLLAYQRPSAAPTLRDTVAAGHEEQKAEEPRIVPQVSDSFIDRLISLTDQNADREFRQGLATEFKARSLGSIPYESEVDFFQRLLAQAKSGKNEVVPSNLPLASIRGQIEQVLQQLSLLYLAVSRSINPSTQLYSITGPATVFVSRGVSLFRLAVYGFALLLALLLAQIMIIVLRERIRHEESREQSDRG